MNVPAKQGVVVARRTVTKYRQLLHIDPVLRRRHIAGSQEHIRQQEVV